MKFRLPLRTLIIECINDWDDTLSWADYQIEVAPFLDFNLHRDIDELNSFLEAKETPQNMDQIESILGLIELMESLYVDTINELFDAINDMYKTLQ